MTLFRDRYRIESARLSGWDYASAGTYFVTICTRDRTCWLGDIIDEEVRLSEIGEIVERFWKEIPFHIQGIVLDEFVVMPNHVHGIVILHGTHEDERDGRDGRDVACYVSTPSTPSTPSTSSTRSTRSTRSISPVPGSLGAAIRSFKSAVILWCRKNRHNFAWQPRFYDQIIRDETTLTAVRAYIRNNPLQWVLDREHPTNA